MIIRFQNNLFWVPVDMNKSVFNYDWKDELEVIDKLFYTYFNLSAIFYP